MLEEGNDVGSSEKGKDQLILVRLENMSEVVHHTVEIYENRLRVSRDEASFITKYFKFTL